MHLRPIRDGRGQLSAHVLDLRQQVEGGQILGTLLKKRGDLELRVVELSDFHENRGVKQAVVHGHKIVQHGPIFILGRAPFSGDA